MSSLYSSYKADKFIEIAIFFLFFTIAALALYFPYHTTFFALVLFGSWHLSSEYTYWFSDKKIAKRQKYYPRLILIGGMALAAQALTQIFLNNVNQEELIHQTEFNLCLIGLWIPLSVLPVTQKGSGKRYILILLLFTLPLLVWFFPFWTAFTLIHFHNFAPWIFASRETKKPAKKKFMFKAIGISIVIPFIAGLIWLSSQLNISKISLGNLLETDLYQHVLSPDKTWGTLLLSFFAYQQFVHYWLWIIEIPGMNSRKPWADLWKWIPEFFRLLGFRKVDKKYYKPLPFLLIMLSFMLFALFPVEWRRIYFILATFHVLIEWPLIFTN